MPLAPFWIIDALTAHLLARGRGQIIAVSSGIGFLPSRSCPPTARRWPRLTRYSQALRAQLAGSGVEVTELAVPPAKATRVWGSNPHALALDGLPYLGPGVPGGPGVFSSASSRAVRRLISPSRMRVLIVLRGTPSMALAWG